MESKAKPIEWAIKEIKEQEFMVNEYIEQISTVNFNYHVDLTILVPNELINIAITSTYVDATSKEVFMKGRTMTSYQIKDMKSMSKKAENGNDLVDLPEPLWISLFSIAYTHARALLAKGSAGTKYSHMLLPAINPTTEFKKLFGPHLKEST